MGLLSQRNKSVVDEIIVNIFRRIFRTEIVPSAKSDEGRGKFMMPGQHLVVHQNDKKSFLLYWVYRIEDDYTLVNINLPLKTNLRKYVTNKLQKNHCLLVINDLNSSSQWVLSYQYLYLCSQKSAFLQLQFADMEKVQILPWTGFVGI